MIARVKNAIEQLEAIDENNPNAYQQAIDAYRSMQQGVAYIDVLENGTQVIRSRTHQPHEIIFEKLSDLFIAPSAARTRFGRCNKPGQSILYTSETRPISFVEFVNSWLKFASDKDKLLVTACKYYTQRNFNLLVVTTPDIHLRTSPFDKHYGKGLDNFLAQCDQETRDGLILLYRFLFEQFRKQATDVKTYLITAAYCNFMFDALGDRVDGMMYPSVPAMEIGLNFAFKEIVSTCDNFKPEMIIRNEMTCITDANGKLGFQETGIRYPIKFDVQQNLISW